MCSIEAVFKAATGFIRYHPKLLLFKTLDDIEL
jgi:hypothetical protein